MAKMDTAESRPMVKSADRVLDLFELLARWGRPMSHTELAEQLGIPKSSLTQLLQTLVHRGYLVFAPDRRTYLLGPSLLALARQQRGARDIVALALPVLEEITRITGESSALNLLRGDETVVAATVLGPHRLVSHMREGDVAPLYATSGGKILLSFLPEGMREEYLARVQFERILPNTLRTAAALRQEIDTVRAEAVAFVNEEFTKGIVGLAVPVRAAPPFADAPLPGALSVAMPSVRYTPQVHADVVVALKRAALQLERSLRNPDL